MKRPSARLQQNKWIRMTEEAQQPMAQLRLMQMELPAMLQELLLAPDPLLAVLRLLVGLHRRALLEQRSRLLMPRPPLQELLQASPGAPAAAAPPMLAASYPTGKPLPS